MAISVFGVVGGRELGIGATTAVCSHLRASACLQARVLSWSHLHSVRSSSRVETATPASRAVLDGGMLAKVLPPAPIPRTAGPDKLQPRCSPTAAPPSLVLLHLHFCTLHFVLLIKIIELLKR